MNFATWIKEVDIIFASKIGLQHDDFPDFTWRDEYDDEATPKDAFIAFCFEYGDEMPELMAFV